MPKRRKPAETLDDLILSAGMTAAQAADRAGVSRATVWNLRTGRHAGHQSTIVALARVLGVDAVRVRDAILASGRGKG